MHRRTAGHVGKPALNLAEAGGDMLESGGFCYRML